jgi:hypothetical protein
MQLGKGLYRGYFKESFVLKERKNKMGEKNKPVLEGILKEGFADTGSCFALLHIYRTKDEGILYDSEKDKISFRYSLKEHNK